VPVHSGAEGGVRGQLGEPIAEVFVGKGVYVLEQEIPLEYLGEEVNSEQFLVGKEGFGIVGKSLAMELQIVLILFTNKTI
jgi:hypothetical protein